MDNAFKVVDYAVIGNYKIKNEVFYSVMWLDSGARELGFTSYEEAEKHIFNVQHPYMCLELGCTVATKEKFTWCDKHKPQEKVEDYG